MMRSKSFETQKVRKIGRKEAGESKGFSILWMGIIEDVFLMEGKKCKIQERFESEGKNFCHSKEDALAWDRQFCVGQWE